MCGKVVIFWLYLLGAPESQPYTLMQAKALAMTAVDIFMKPHLLNDIKDNFTRDLKSQA